MTRQHEVTTPDELQEDTQPELSLRPQRLAEFIGQDKVKETLSIAIEAAKQRREPLDHLLFHGPPGLGKTTLAALLAREMGVYMAISPDAHRAARLVDYRHGAELAQAAGITCAHILNTLTSDQLRRHFAKGFRKSR